MSLDKTAVLLVNLGTPDAPKPWSVFRYLNEFLTDGRVIDAPWLIRQILTRLIIVPTRFLSSTRAYQEIWTKEGSPLKVHGYALKEALEKLLEEGSAGSYDVFFAMRYQNPSIASVLKNIHKGNYKKLVVLPLFPQYASATTGSIYQRVMEEIKDWQTMPELKIINHFADQEKMIEAFVNRAQNFDLGSYDHILFSYHGLPKRQLKKANPKNCCLESADCCQAQKNPSCYQAQTFQTTRALTQALGLSPDRYTHCFQSRLGKDPWLEPFTEATILKRAKQGDQRLLVFCPSFVCDCLETSYEIGQEYQELFVSQGGKKIDLVPGLGSHPRFVEGLKDLVCQ